MKKKIILLISIFTLFSCSDSSSNSLVNDIEVIEFQKLVEEGEGTLIDVRTASEFSESHIEGAQNIDVNNDNFNSLILTLDKTKPVYVYCKSGGRSGKATDLMANLGFTSIFNLEGGITTWKKANFKTIK